MSSKMMVTCCLASTTLAQLLPALSARGLPVCARSTALAISPMIASAAAATGEPAALIDSPRGDGQGGGAQGTEDGASN
jgi:hypothetical protein